MLAPEAHADWQAIGRLNRAGYRTQAQCSATLIAPRLVMTAAHCVTRTDGSPVNLTDLRFVAGWLRGDYAALGMAASVDLPRTWIDGLRAGEIRPAVDIALVTLTEPITTVPPIPLSAPHLDLEVRILGYRWDRPHALSDSGECTYTVMDDGAARTACKVTFGTSGAPVLQKLDGTWHLVGVVSGIGGGLTWFAPYRTDALDDVQELRTD